MHCNRNDTSAVGRYVRVQDASRSVRRRSSHGHRLQKRKVECESPTAFTPTLTDYMDTSVESPSGAWEAAESEQDTLRHGLLSCASQVDSLGRIVRPESKVELVTIRCCGYQVAI